MSTVRHRLRGVSLLALTLAVASAPAAALRVVTWNVLHYPPGRDADYRAVLSALQPDVLVLQEMDNQTEVNAFLANVLNAAGGPGGYAAATFTDGFDSDNALYYRTSTVTFAGPADHVDVNTSLRQIDRWKVGLVGYSAEASKLYVYSMHLKAGSTSSDQTQRLSETTLLRGNANGLPAGVHFVYAGDLNVRSSSEAAYAQQLTGSMANNIGRGFDPIGMPGNWNNNAAFVGIHTQSPHSNNSNAPPGAATGGMDDRFDQQLVSAALLDGDGLDYAVGTYHAFGNDGLHFNLDINDAPTIPEGAAMANALHATSDHLPLVADYQVPAVVVADASLDFGTVIVGASAQAILSVSNGGNLALFGFVDDLDYTLSAPAGFSAPAGSFADLAGGGGNQHAVTLDTASAAVRTGDLTVASDDVDTPARLVPLSGTVLDHARPSLAAGMVQTAGAVDFGAHAPGGFSDQPVQVHNVGFGALQALVEVHAAQITGPDAARFSIVGGFAPFQVGGSPGSLTLAFDDSGPAASYSADLVLSTRDQQDLAGATNLASLTVQLDATIAPPLDTKGGTSHGGGLRGPITLTASSASGGSLALLAGGLEPGARAVVVVSPRPGLTRAGRCADLAVGLDAPRVLAVVTADARGRASVPVPRALSRLGPQLLAQVVDPAGCAASPVLRLDL